MMASMEKKLYCIIHNHRFGTSVGFVKASEEPSEEAACKALDFDYETDPIMEESVEVIEVTPKEAVELD